VPRLVLLLGSTLVTLVAAELLFRAFDLRGYHDRRQELGVRGAYLRNDSMRVPGIKVQFRPYARFAHAYDSDPRGYFGRERRIVDRLDCYGFRGPNWTRDKAPGVRLEELLNGDSGAEIEVLTLAARALADFIRQEKLLPDEPRDERTSQGG
jgi:hypothetical protein